MTIALWIVQGLLALMFLFAGIRKAFQPLPVVKKNFPWANYIPAGLTRFIGVSELLGALGLVLPAVTGILPWLTIAAALGLAVVMVCAMTTSLVESFLSWESILSSCFLRSFSLLVVGDWLLCKRLLFV